MSHTTIHAILSRLLSSLLGWQGDIKTISELVVGEGKLLPTLTGPGGIGKTRLAEQLEMFQ